MNKMLGLLFLLFLNTSLNAQDIVGFWKTINEDTHKPESIVAIYEYQGKYYGRLVAAFNHEGVVDDTIDHPQSRAPGVVGKPFYSGLDIIWDLQKKGDKYSGGQILDPQHGRVYDVEVWVEHGKLMVRGKLFIFGRNQTWLPLVDHYVPSEFQKPDIAKFVPHIPKVIPASS